MVATPLAVVVIASAVGLAGLLLAGLFLGATREGAMPGARRTALVVGAAISAWAVLSFAMGARGDFAATRTSFDFLIPLGIGVPVIVGLAFLARSASFQRLAEGLPAPWLIGSQVYRVLGVTFLLALNQASMPAEFALSAGLGDIAIGLLAPVVAYTLARRTPASRSVAVAWNLAGIADLVVAVTLGFLTSPSPFQVLALGHPNAAITRFPFVLIPTFAVPVSVLLHVITLWRLRSAGEADARRPDARRTGWVPGGLPHAHGRARSPAD